MSPKIVLRRMHALEVPAVSVFFSLEAYGSGLYEALREAAALEGQLDRVTAVGFDYMPETDFHPERLKEALLNAGLLLPFLAFSDKVIKTRPSQGSSLPLSLSLSLSLPISLFLPFSCSCFALSISLYIHIYIYISLSLSLPLSLSISLIYTYMVLT